MRFLPFLALAMLLGCGADDTARTGDAAPEASAETVPPAAAPLPEPMGDTDLEREVSAFAQKVYNIPVTAIECRPFGEAALTVCTFTAGGISVGAEVYDRDDGTRSIVPINFASRDLLERASAKLMEEPYGNGLTSTCDVPVALRTPVGGTVLCHVAEPDGTAHPVELTFLNVKGSIDYRELPSAEPPPAN